MKEVKSPKKPLIYYYCIVLLVLMVFNSFIVPLIARQQIKEVDYGTFMSMTEKGEIGKVEIESNQILFTDKDGQNVYKTGVMDDPNLTERLYASGAQFATEIVEEASPLMSFFLTWILPVVLFVALGQLLYKKMIEKMGGGPNSMMFGLGNNNAKVYVPSTTEGSALPMWQVRTKPRTIFKKSSITCMTPVNIRPSVLPCPKGSCWWALPEPVRPCWPRRWRGKQMCPSSPFPARNL